MVKKTKANLTLSNIPWSEMHQKAELMFFRQLEVVFYHVICHCPSGKQDHCTIFNNFITNY